MKLLVDFKIDIEIIYIWMEKIKMFKTKFV